MRGKIPNEGGESLLVLLRGVGGYNDVAALGQPFERDDGVSPTQEMRVIPWWESKLSVWTSVVKIQV